MEAVGSLTMIKVPGAGSCWAHASGDLVIALRHVSLLDRAARKLAWANAFAKQQEINKTTQLFLTEMIRRIEDAVRFRACERAVRRRVRE